VRAHHFQILLHVCESAKQPSDPQGSFVAHLWWLLPVQVHQWSNAILDFGGFDACRRYSTFRTVGLLGYDHRPTYLPHPANESC